MPSDRHSAHERQEVTGRRVAMVKPGDILLIGNAGQVTEDLVNRLSEALHTLLNVPVIIFAEDIDLGLVSADALGMVTTDRPAGLLADDQHGTQ